MYTSEKISAARWLLLTSLMFSATAVMAATPTPATTATINEHATLSPEQQQTAQASIRAQNGREAMSYIVAARQLISEQHDEEARQYLEQAKGLLTNLQSEITSGDENTSDLLPIYSQLGVKEGVEITDQLKQELGKAHLDALNGNHKEVVETLKAVDIELQYSFVDLPVAATLEKIESALQSLSTKDSQAAGKTLADVEAGLIHDSIVINSNDENLAG